MNRMNAVALGFALSLALGANAVAGGVAPMNSASPPQVVATYATGTAPNSMTIPLLVSIAGNGRIKEIQHSLRLPASVDRLLWQNMRSWVKAPPIVNGRRTGAQVLMRVALQVQPQADGNSSANLTLVSVGPVMRGHWKIWGDRMVGHCSATGDVAAGSGGVTNRCVRKLPAVTVTGASPAQ